MALFQLLPTKEEGRVLLEGLLLLLAKNELTVPSDDDVIWKLITQLTNR